jgi:hypothetical protein
MWSEEFVFSPDEGPAGRGETLQFSIVKDTFRCKQGDKGVCYLLSHKAYLSQSPC